MPYECTYQCMHILDYVFDLQHYADNTTLDSVTEGPHLHIGEAIAIPRDVVENTSIPRP